MSGWRRSERGPVERHLHVELADAATGGLQPIDGTATPTGEAPVEARDAYDRPT